MANSSLINKIPSSLSDTDESAIIEKKWKNFTEETIDSLQPLIPNVDVKAIPGWGGDDDGDGQPSANFAVFMMSLIFAIFWITYITFFNSRVFGSLLTRLANSKFLKTFIGDTGGYIKIGSLSWSVLPGKVMFRDIAYITSDYTLRVQDGFLIFRWWRKYVPKDASEDLSHSDTRASIQLNGFEYHVYNRSSVYRELEKKFCLEPKLFGPEKSDDDLDSSDNKSTNDSDKRTQILNSEGVGKKGKNWRDLVPVIKVDISSGKVVFGNRTLPRTLVVSFEEARCTYSTKPAACSLDHWMHSLKCKAENFKILLASSPKYTGLRDEPPRYMGQGGFVVASSNEVDVYYYMDEPGYIQENQAPKTIENDPSYAQENWEPFGGTLPEWGMNIKCGKGTNFCYGPWADRQREQIYKFFYPADYQDNKPTPAPKQGDKREAPIFRLRISTQHNSTLELYFSNHKSKRTENIHLQMDPGTNFEVKIPWNCSSDGFTTNFNGTLMKPEATTSLPYRDLIRCETLHIDLDMKYPLKWNEHQEWNFRFTGSKTSLNFIFAHKWFFQDMIDDWSSKNPPDLLYYVPYTWKFEFILNEFELITLANEFNWIDTSSTDTENTLLSICGSSLTVKFDMPYTEFLPQIIPFFFQIRGQKLDLAIYLPQTTSSRDILWSLDSNAKIATRDGQNIWKKELNKGKWRSDKNGCSYEDGWIDCWTAPKVILDIKFDFHATPIPGPCPEADISETEKENDLLHPLRVPSIALLATSPEDNLDTILESFDPATMIADKCTVKLRADSSTAYLYGTLLRLFMHVKENLFGEDQQFTTMDNSTAGKNVSFHIGGKMKNDRTKSTGILDMKPDMLDISDEFDPRMYRPIEVILDISVTNLITHLMKHCSEFDPPCPYLTVEQLYCEMNKTYRETRLQVQLSPIVLRSSDVLSHISGSRPIPKSNKRNLFADEQSSQGHCLLTGFQFRGNAMFSELDRPLGSDTLEYSWLIEVQCGTIIGKMSASQLYNIVVAAESLLFLAVDKENVLKHPRSYKLCQHTENQKECSYNNHETELCHTVEDLKYRLVRFSADALDFTIVEKANSALRIQACPLRLATCNLHGLQAIQGITAIVNDIRLQQYISSNFPLNRSDYDQQIHHQDIWIESGVIKFGPINIEGSLSGHSSSDHNNKSYQHKFLQKHDQKTKRLWFLWPKAIIKDRGVPKDAMGNCGCIGGCSFFGLNENGIRFFSPCHTDISRRHNVAIPSLGDKSKNPRFGQSIIHNRHLNINNKKLFKYVYENIEEPFLPPKWPQFNREPDKLAFCPDYRTHRSSSSNNSGDTPSHPKYHRSFSGKHGTPTSEFSNQSHLGGLSVDVRKYRSSSACVNSVDRPQTANVKNSSAIHVKEMASADPSHQFATTPNRSNGHRNILGQEEPDFKSIETNVDVTVRPKSVNEIHLAESENCSAQDSRHPMVRTESLVSDVLSFYSLDGEDAISGSKISIGGSTSVPVSPRISLLSSEGTSNINSTTNYFSANSGPEWHSGSLGSKSTQFESADDKTLSFQNTNSEISSITLSPTSTQYQTASQGYSSPKDLSISLSNAPRDSTSSQISFDTATLQPETPLPEDIDTTQSRMNVRSVQLGRVSSGRDDTVSRTLSDGSYISAQSENDEFSLVNLQLQVEKPITESPLLMSSYISHLTQLRCSNWNSSVSSYPEEITTSSNSAEALKNDSSLTNGIKSPLDYFPMFDVIEEGFSNINMVDKDVDLESDECAHSFTNFRNADVSKNVSNDPDSESSEKSPRSLSDAHEEMSLTVDSNTAKTTLVVKFRGSVDIVLSPVVLESFQRMFESVTPLFQTLHPLSVINHLHSAALDRVESKNSLKKEKSLELQDKLVIDTTGRDGGRIHGLTKGLISRKLRTNAKENLGNAPTEIVRTFEKSISSYVEASLHLPKVNLMVLQAAVVEDMCSFSALDAVRDITCVSLLAVSIRETTFQFCKMSQSKKAVQVYLQKQRIMSSRGRKKSKYKVAAITDSRQNEPLAFESSETQREEILLTGSLQKMHAQLRRLKNDSSILKDASITAIPHNKSKVFFEYVNIPKLSSFRTNTPVDGEDPAPAMKRNLASGPIKRNPLLNDSDLGAKNEDARLGFNMCECGFEGISVKVAKRSSNQEDIPEPSNQSPSDENTFNVNEEGQDEVNTKLHDTTVIKIEDETNENEPVPEDSKHSINYEQSNKSIRLGKKKTSPQYIPKRGEESVHNYEGDEKDEKSDEKNDTTHHSTEDKKNSVVDSKTDNGSEEDNGSTPEVKFINESSEHGAADEYNPGHGGKHSSSSGSVQLKTSWFNFAAPPKTPISRKIDFTKMDWNLLSTASPSIDVWFNAVDRLQKDVSECLTQYHQRVGSIMASFMSDSLEKASENFLKLTKFDKLTALSRTLRDDPSCQLCSILVKYAMSLDLEEIEKTNLRVDQVPPLITLRQGIVVLSRQWKNELYAPILIEYKLRSRNFKNLFNTQDQYDSIIAKAEFEGSEFDEEEGGSSEEDASELEDEQSLLIKNNPANCSVASNSSGFLGVGQLSPSQFGLPLLKEDPVLRLIDPRRRYSGDSELLSFPYDPTAVQSESVTQVNSGEITPTSKVMGQNESLYDWMRRETEKSVETWKRNLSVKSGSNGSVEKDNGTLQQDVLPDETITNIGGKLIENIDQRKIDEESRDKKDGNNAQTTPSTPQTKSMNLLDAHIIFEPLLSSLGLMPQQIQNVSLKNLGKNISVLANVDVFKIDIVESDFFGTARQRSRRGKTIGNPKTNSDNDTSSPAFLCEKMYVQLDHKKVTDLQNTMGNDIKDLPLYISRAQMRRHTSKYVNFNIDISNISPKINMPLLRLLNQILTMHQNIRETNEELKDKKPGESQEITDKSKEVLRRHNKSNSNASSSSSNISLAQLRQTDNELDLETSANEEKLIIIETPMKSLDNITIMNSSHVDNSSSDFTLVAKNRASNSEQIRQSSPPMTLKSQLKSRPKSFAQKFRPNSRLAGMTGYSNIGESPVQEPKDSFIITSAPLERISEEKTTQKCWKTMYNLLELYSTMPTTKTVHRQSMISHANTAANGLDTGILLKPVRKSAISNTTVPDPTANFMKNGEIDELSKSNTSVLPDKNTASQEPSTPLGRPFNQLSEQQVEFMVGTHRIENETTPVNSAPRANNSTKKAKGVSFAKTDLVRREHTPLIVSGTAKIHRTKLMATLSGLKLEGEITGLESSLQYKEKMRAPLKGVVEARVEGSMKETSIVLLEAIPPKQQTVVKVTIGKSEVIHSSHMWKTKDKNSGTLFVELVQVDIPQHPVDLHSIVTRGTKELSSTLEEFKGARILKRGTTFIKDSGGNDGMDTANPMRQESPSIKRKDDLPKTPTTTKVEFATPKPTKSDILKSPTEDSNLIKPFVMSFNVTLDKLLICAALLPSLEAEYSMSKVTSKGVTGSKAKFVVEIPKHKLSFNTKLGNTQEKFGNKDPVSIAASELEAEDNIGDNILPKEASIDLPLVHVSAAYIVQEIGESSGPTMGDDGSIVIEGNYLKAEAEIGELQHTLTTDLLNHLVFVQKVFMKEVNEVVQKMSGSDRPVPVWSEFGELVEEVPQASQRPLLFSVTVRLREITITATTPSNSFVRFETENLSELQLSNGIENVVGGISGSRRSNHKISTQAKIDLKLSLGQVIRDQVYYEAATEYQHQAYFKTSIQLRNAFQGEDHFGESSQEYSGNEPEKDIINITLSRPLVFVQPVAVDRAILFWLSYKNAYEYWTDQRLKLNNEVLEATDQVLEKLPISQITSQLSSQHVGTLFLQLNVKDIGVCLPLATAESLPNPIGNRLPGLDSSGPGLQGNTDTMGAIIATVKSSSISACSAASMVSTGKFVDLCVRFSDDFHHSLDDWKPDPKDFQIMNLCKVEEGSYEVCSKTAKAVTDPSGSVLENAKWFLNIQWKMKGVNAKVDTNIGKYMSNLGQTLTAIGNTPARTDINYAGYGEETNTESSSITDTEEELHEGNQMFTGANLRRQTTRQTIDLDLPAYLFDPNLERSVKAKYLDADINEQSKTVDDLQKLGASEATINTEKKKLDELQNIASQNFRYDIAQKLKRTKSKASYIKEKFGLGIEQHDGPTPRTHRFRKSSSVIAASPIKEESDKPFGKLKKIKSGETLSTMEEVDYEESESSLSEKVKPADLSIGEKPYTQSDELLFHEYDESPHFPRDKSKFNISPKSTLNVTSSSSTSTIKPSNNATITGASTEQDVDFELHIKVEINRGECVLHTEDQDSNVGSRQPKMRKDRSFSGNVFDQSGGSPSMSRKSRHGGPELSNRLRDSANYRYSSTAHGQLPDETIFFIPGLDVRAHYVSKREIEETILFDTSARSGIQGKSRTDAARSANASWLSSTRKMGNKKATLSAWMTLQSIPEETLITPHILEFLERALEPIPTFSSSSNTTPDANTATIMTSAAKDLEDEGGINDGISSASDSQVGQLPAVYGQFPVDVIVYFHMQGSTFRFSCAPVSRVECMLRLPSLDLVFSSKRADGYVNDEFAVKDICSNNSTSEMRKEDIMTSNNWGKLVPGKTDPCNNDSPGEKSSHSSSLNDTFEEGIQASSVTGGLSVTGCLNDFDLCVFHPYGFRKKENAGDNVFSPLTSEERKDSLSVSVAFVKFHISRSRKVNYEDGNANKSSNDSGANVSTQYIFNKASAKEEAGYNTNVGQTNDSRGIACVRFSTIVDIGSASFKYDMRRLTEILAFPRAWYRRTLVRRLFLGEMKTTSFHTEQVASPASNPNIDQTKEPKLSTGSGRRASVNVATISSPKDRRASLIGMPQPAPQDAVTWIGKTTAHLWETLVVFAVHFKVLKVQMNMGNVMGNVDWISKDFRSEGRLSFNSIGHKNMFISLGLNSSTLEAKAGIVGGSIDIGRIDTYCHFKEDSGIEPFHELGLQLDVIAIRFDYMSNCALMGRISHLELSVKDDWHVQEVTSPPQIFVQGDLNWDQLQMLISKSTTADLIKIVNKLEEFFSNQFKSSKKLFSDLEPLSNTNVRDKYKNRERANRSTHSGASSSKNTEDYGVSHHRHWQKALKKISGLKIYTLPFKLPDVGSVLGGVLELRGKHISLACFHGINFKSRSWALFSLKEPSITFVSDATQVMETSSHMNENENDFHSKGDSVSESRRDELVTTILQTLSVCLGQPESQMDQPSRSTDTGYMATVKKLSRVSTYLPPFKALTDWFIYAFKSSDLDEVHRFPILFQGSAQSDKGPDREVMKTQQRTEEIFALPCLRLDLKTKHVQGEGKPEQGGSRPLVDCTLVTDFDNHIFVTTDAEAFFFLHDLITSYLKEKERVLSIQQKALDSFQGHHNEKSKPSQGQDNQDDTKIEGDKLKTDSLKSDSKNRKHKIDPLHNDWRKFECNTWHLEPTVRLISTFGSQIEPYGVDLILSKLGFSHARTTIPKWLQRGCMDPMDKIMSIVVLKAIQSVKEDPKQPKTEEAGAGDGNVSAFNLPKYSSRSASGSTYYSSTPTSASIPRRGNKNLAKRS